MKAKGELREGWKRDGRGKIIRSEECVIYTTATVCVTSRNRLPMIAFVSHHVLEIEIDLPMIAFVRYCIIKIENLQPAGEMRFDKQADG